LPSFSTRLLKREVQSSQVGPLTATMCPSIWLMTAQRDGSLVLAQCPHHPRLRLMRQCPLHLRLMIWIIFARRLWMEERRRHQRGKHSVDCMCQPWQVLFLHLIPLFRLRQLPRPQQLQRHLLQLQRRHRLRAQQHYQTRRQLRVHPRSQRR